MRRAGRRRAGQAHLRRQPGQPRPGARLPAAAVRPGRHPRRGDWSTRPSAGADEVVHFAAETHVDRSILGAAEFVRTNVVGTQTCCSTPPSGRRRAVRARLDRRGLRLDRRGLVAGDRPARSRTRRTRRPRPASDLLARALPPHPRPAGRASPAARTTTGPTSSRRRSSRCSSPTCSTASTVPLYGDGLQRPRLAARRRPLPRHRSSCRTGGRAGEVYNIGGGTELTNRELTEPAARGLGAGRVAGRAGRRPQGPRPPLLRRHRQDPRRARLRPAGRLRPGARRRPSPGTATTGPGGSRSRPGAGLPA